MNPLAQSLLYVGVLAACARGDIIFQEDFDGLPDGENITTSNTDFDYVRIGSGGGAIEASNPGNFSGASMSLGGSDSGSLNGVGLQSGLGELDFLSMKFDYRSSDVAHGDLVMISGQGNTFTGNGTFNTNQLFYGVQFNNGTVEYRSDSGAGADWVSTEFSLQNNTDYSIEILGNRTGSDVLFESGMVKDHSLNIVINDILVADGVAFSSNELADAFRIYQVNGEQFYEMDNIVLRNQFSAVPEPSTISLLGLIASSVLIRHRRRYSLIG